MSNIKVGRSPKVTELLNDYYFTFDEVDLYDNEDLGYYKVYGDYYRTSADIKRLLMCEFPNWHFDFCNKGSQSFCFGRVKNFSKLSDYDKYRIMENEV